MNLDVYSGTGGVCKGAMGSRVGGGLSIEGMGRMRVWGLKNRQQKGKLILLGDIL